MNCRAQLVGNTYQIKSFIAKRQNDYQKIKELIVTAVEGILRDNSNPTSRESEYICVFIGDPETRTVMRPSVSTLSFIAASFTVFRNIFHFWYFNWPK